MNWGKVFGSSQNKRQCEQVEDDKRLYWRLPLLYTRDLGRLGPGFGYGVGCGVGLGAGVIGGAGLGFGFPGIQFGLGLGAGCGIGIGFGYGLGKGRAHDEHGRHSNVGKLRSRQGNSSSRAEMGAIIDDFILGLKRSLENMEREREKWRKY